MIIADVDNGKLVRLCVTYGETIEMDLPIAGKSKMVINGYRCMADIQVQVDRIIDVSD